MPKLYAQKWFEYESGWGERPDGYSLHLRSEDVDDFEAELEELSAGRASDSETHSHRDGLPFAVEVEQEIYDRVADCKFGLMFAGGKWREVEAKKI